MSLLFTSGGQCIGASASASVLLIEYSGLISFRIDWFDLLAVQGTLKSLLQHNGLKASIFGTQPFFFLVQFSYPYITTGKPIALTRQTFVVIMSLLFNTLSRFVIAFLPRSKHLLLFIYLFFGHAAQLLGS